MKDLTNNTILSMIYTHLVTIKKLARDLKNLKKEAGKRGMI